MKLEQLKLSEEQLLEIGFSKREWASIRPTEDNPHGSVTTTTWEIPTRNGCFYYNNDEDIYAWFHKTIIGDGANFVNLDIINKASLFTVLSAFRVKFNVVIND